VSKLYEEMEAQIKTEKSRIIAQEKLKERELREKLNLSLMDKEKELQESVNKLSEMEQKLYKINLADYQQKQENDKLLKVKHRIKLKQLTFKFYLFCPYFRISKKWKSYYLKKQKN
jgi:hypothetical protein